MADATVTGAFVLIDRASRPMEQMERQALKTDAAIRGMGDRLDETGTRNQTQQLEDTNRKIQDIDRSSTHAGSDRGGLSTTAKRVRNLGDESDGATSKLIRLGMAIASVGKVLMALKIPAVAAGIGILGQAIGALVGGVVALVPQLLDLGGVAGALPAGLLGAASAAITLKLAFSGIGPALKGTKGAMKDLTPQAREFVRVLKDLKPLGKTLRESAQAELFPGLTSALQKLRKGAPYARHILRQSGGVIGDTAEKAAGQFTKPAFLQDMLDLGSQGNHIMRRFGDAILNVVQAIRHVAVAAMPFTKWLTQTILGWTRGWKEAARFGRETGSLKGYFDRTRHSMELFGDILKNLWGALKGVLEAARPLGNELWHSADRATKRWNNFANSVGGQIQLTSYFESLSENLHSMFNLVGELAKAIMRMGDEPGLAQVADTLTESVAPLEEAFNNLGNNLGPQLAETVKQLIILFKNLSSQAGVFGNLLGVFNKFLEVVNALLEKIPGLANLLSFALAGVALNKLFGKLREVAGGWGLITAQANIAAAAQGRAAATGLASPGVIPGRGGRGAPGGVVPVGGRGASTTGRAIPGGVVPIATGPLSRGGKPMIGKGGWGYNTGTPRAGQPFNPRTTQIPTSAGEAAAARLPWLGGAAGLGGMQSGAGAALRGAGKFAWPVAAFFALSDFLTFQGGIGGKTQAAASGATLGAIPMPLTGEQQTQRGSQAAQERLKTMTRNIAGSTTGGRRGDLAALKDRLGIGVRDPRELLGQAGGGDVLGVSGFFSDIYDDKGAAAAKKAFKKAREQVNTELKQQSLAAGQDAVGDFGKAFNIYAQKGKLGQGAKQMLDPLLARIRHIGPEGGRILGDASLHWYAAAAKRNPKLKGVYDDLVAGIEKRFRRMGVAVEVINGNIYTGTRKDWKNISDAMGSQAEKAAERTRKAFTEIQRQAFGVLRAMGFNPAQARGIVQDLEKGGQAGQVAAIDAKSGPTGSGQTLSQSDKNKAAGSPAGARGMRIPGKGLQDGTPLGITGIGAPGELVVNRHTEDRLDAQLGGSGKTARAVAGETKGHAESRSAPRGPFREMNAALGLRLLRRGGRAGAAATATTGGGLAAAAKLAQGYGLSISGGPGFGGIPSSGHATNSLHYSGLAYDVSGAAATMRRFRVAAQRAFMGHGLNELFYDPYPYYIDEGHRVPGAIGGHSDHVHIGFFPGASGMRAGAAGGGAAAAPQKIHLKAPTSGQMGVQGAMANRAMAMMASGVEQKINRRLRAGGGAGGRGGGSPAANKAVARGMLGRFGWGADQMGPLNSLWTQESGWSQTARNPSSGAYGIPQGLPPGKMGAAAQGGGAAAARAQIAWGLGYIKSRYGSPAGAWGHEQANNWYSMGGRVPGFAGWFGGEGSVTASKPTLLGIGDQGKETAVITKGGGGGRPIHIGSIKIENHRPGDIQKQLRREVEKFANDLERELDDQPDVGHEAIL